MMPSSRLLQLMNICKHYSKRSDIISACHSSLIVMFVTVALFSSPLMNCIMVTTCSASVSGRDKHCSLRYFALETVKHYFNSRATKFCKFL